MCFYVDINFPFESWQGGIFVDIVFEVTRSFDFETHESRAVLLFDAENLRKKKLPPRGIISEK